jgi:hypothetical protein
MIGVMNVLVRRFDFADSFGVEVIERSVPALDLEAKLLCEFLVARLFLLSQSSPFENSDAAQHRRRL